VRRFFSDQRKWTPYLFIAPFFITFAVFTLWPFAKAVVMAFQESTGYSRTWEWVGLANFEEMITNDDKIRIAFRNGLLYFLGSVVMQFPAAFALAALLTSKHLRFKGVFRTLAFVPSVVPGSTVGVIANWFFSDRFGFFASLFVALGGEQSFEWGLKPWFILPSMLLMAFVLYTGSHAVFFMAGMSGISQSLIEAAVVDGATAWQRARYIILPLLKPVITYSLVSTMAGSLLMYEFPAMYMGVSGGPGGQGWFALPYLTDMAFNKFRMGYATAIGWALFGFGLIATYVQLQRFDFRDEGAF
jgi:ABC-type sugar transport system permease subunit